LQNAVIASAVVGIRTLEQLKDAAETVSVPGLTEAETEQLRESVEKNLYKEHR
jgi:aryl-alcohol dehydrogenase-like predicted oxidoreductase